MYDKKLSANIDDFIDYLRARLLYLRDKYNQN